MLAAVFGLISTVGGVSGNEPPPTNKYYKEPLVFDLAPDPAKPLSTIERFGPVGLGLDLIQPAFTMRIKNVEDASPAAASGRLKAGQIIETINGERLKDIDPRIQLGNIISAAETTDGIIKLMVKDAPASAAAREEIVKIPVLGAYSKTWPLNCPKSDKIIRNFADYLAKPDANQGFSGIGMLFLLGTGEEKDLAPVRKWARGLADQQVSRYSWHLGLGGIPLCEYYLRTGDEAVLPVIQKWVDSALAGEYFGGWGHKGICAAPTYGPGGGQINAGGTAVVTFLMLAKECGAKIPDDTLNRVLTRFYRYAGRGLVPYGDGRPEYGFVDNGKNGNLAFAMAAAATLTPDGENSVYAKARDISAKSSFYTNSYMLHGHTGGGVGEVWRSSAMGLLQEKLPRQYREFMDSRRWHYELSRRCDGSFGILGGARNYDNQSWGAAYALTYIVPRKTLRITGAPSAKFSKPYKLPEHPWGTKADEAFLSLQPATLPDGTRPDFSGETMTKDHAWAILQRLNQLDVDDATLQRYAHHPDSCVRFVAARRAVGLVSNHLSGRPYPGGEIRAKLAMDLFHSADPRVRRAILHAMNEGLKNEQAFMSLLGQKGCDELIAMLRDPAESWWVKDAALVLISHAPADVVAPHVDLILGFVNDKDTWLQSAALDALSPVLGDERCYAKVIPIMAEKVRTCNQMSIVARTMWWAPLGSKLKNLPPAAEKLWEESISKALVNYTAPKRAPGGLDTTRLYDYFLSDLAGKIIVTKNGYNMLYEGSKKLWPDNPFYFSKIFLKADPQKFGPELKKAYAPWVRKQLIPEFMANNLEVLLKEADSGQVLRGEQPAMDKLVKLYQEIDVSDYDWRDYGPAWNQMQWNYFTFDLPAKAADDVRRSPRKVIFPAGMEKWNTPSFAPGMAGWKKGNQPFGQIDGQLMKQQRPSGTEFCRSTILQQTLWDKDVLLLNGKFQFPKFREGYRYRLVVGGVGNGFQVYINGKQLVERKEAELRGNVSFFDCPQIGKKMWPDFDSEVTIAAIGFLGLKTTTPLKRPFPNGDFSIWLQEMKVPPLGKEEILRAAMAVPMFCSEWQAMQDPEREVDDSDEGKFRWDGKFVANPKLLGEWAELGPVDKIDEFNPAKQDIPENSKSSKKFSFYDQGKTSELAQFWSGNVLMDFKGKQAKALGKGMENSEAARAEAQKLVVKTINGTDYLFREVGGFNAEQPAGWKSPWLVMKRSTR